MQSPRLDTRVPPSMAEESTHTVVRSTRPLWGGWWLLCHQIPRDCLTVMGLASLFLRILSAALQASRETLTDTAAYTRRRNYVQHKATGALVACSCAPQGDISRPIMLLTEEKEL